MKEKPDVVVDVALVSMDLREKSELRVGDGGDVEECGLPFESLAPRDPLHTNVGLCAAIEQHRHDGRGPVVTGVHRVEDRRVPVEAMFVDGSLGVDVGTELKEDANGLSIAVLGRHVKKRDANERCELRSVLFEVSATDPRLYAAGAVVVLLATGIAILVPARRAAAADPAGALRAD